jgi:hypothetical protein
MNYNARVQYSFFLLFNFKCFLQNLVCQQTALSHLDTRSRISVALLLPCVRNVITDQGYVFRRPVTLTQKAAETWPHCVNSWTSERELSRNVSLPAVARVHTCYFAHYRLRDSQSAFCVAEFKKQKFKQVISKIMREDVRSTHCLNQRLD